MDEGDDSNVVTYSQLSTVLSETADALTDVLESAKQHVKEGKLKKIILL